MWYRASVMFGSKRSQEGEAGENVEILWMIMVVNNIKHPVMCRQWQYPFPYFVDGQRNLNIHCFDFFLLLETDEWDKVDYNF